MKKRVLLSLSGLLLTALLGVHPAAAKNPPAGKGAPPAKGAPAKGAATAGATQKVHGIVKGAPTGATFVVARPKGGPVTVDAGSTKPRLKGGQFAKMDSIKGGTMVDVEGTMQGATLKATKITVYPKAGGNKAAVDNKKVGLTKGGHKLFAAPAAKSGK